MIAIFVTASLAFLFGYVVCALLVGANRYDERIREIIDSEAEK